MNPIKRHIHQFLNDCPPTTFSGPVRPAIEQIWPPEPKPEFIPLISKRMDNAVLRYLIRAAIVLMVAVVAAQVLHAKGVF